MHYFESQLLRLLGKHRGCGVVGCHDGIAAQELSGIPLQAALQTVGNKIPLRLKRLRPRSQPRPKDAVRQNEHHATKFANQGAKKIASLSDHNAKVKYPE
jgi:hypothetical protein